MRKEKNTIEEEQFEEDPYTGMYWAPSSETHLNTEPEYIEVNVFQDVYKQGKDEEYVLVKKDVKSRKVLYKDDISYVKEVVNKQGLNRITRVELGLRYKDPIIVEGSYNKFKNMLFNKPKQQSKSVGFKFY